ncbi:snf2 family helicase [Moniliophthora roreri]|nr:snf2 family helicase [Moniliophthora roreri]
MSHVLYLQLTSTTVIQPEEGQEKGWRADPVPDGVFGSRDALLHQVKRRLSQLEQWIEKPQGTTEDPFANT